MNYPPKCSDAWTVEERTAYVAWCAEVTLDRIARDHRDLPLLAKRPVRDLFHAIHAVCTWTAEKLEANRAALEKPYDSALDHDGVVLPQELIDRILAR